MFDAVSKIEVSREAEEDKFIALAINGGAKITSSGDDEIKRINSFEGVPLMSPAEFLTRFAPDQ